MKVFQHGAIRVGRNCEFAAYCDFEVHGEGVLEIGEGTYFNRYCMKSITHFVLHILCNIDKVRIFVT